MVFHSSMRTFGMAALAAVMLLSLLAGCGDSPTPSATPTATTGGPAAPTATTATGATAPTPAIPADLPPTSTLKIDNYTFFQEGDSVTIVGAVSNPGPAIVGRMEVVATAKDASGAVLGSGDAVLLTYVELWPGKLAPFRVDIGGLTGQAASVEVTGQAENLAPNDDRAIATRLEVLDTQLLAEEGSRPILTGLVRNTGQLTASDPDVGIVGFDASGKVVNVGRDEVALNNLAPGATAPFRVALYETTPIERFDTLVTASRGSDQPATGLEIGDFNYFDFSGQAVVLGVIRNTSAITLEHLTIAAYAENGDGKVIAVGDDSYLNGSEVNLPPGKVLPFRADLDIAFDQVKQVQAVGEADVYNADDFNFTVPAVLSVSGVEIGSPDGAGGNKMTGTVKNEGTAPATSMWIYAVGYDAQGKLVNSGYASVETDPLASGDTANFEIVFDRSDVAVERFDVQPTGLVQQQ